MNSCPKNVVIAACRSSSSAPKVAMLSNADERCSAALTAYAADSFSRWVATYSG